MKRGQIAGEHDTDLVRENLVALIIHDPAPITITVKAQRHVSSLTTDDFSHGMEHIHVLGIWIIAGKCMIEFGIQWHDLTSQSLQNGGRKCTSCAVAAGGNNFHFPLERCPIGQIGGVALGEVGHEVVGAAV